jgi:hypothetical protein
VQAYASYVGGCNLVPYDTVFYNVGLVPCSACSLPGIIGTVCYDWWRRYYVCRIVSCEQAPSKESPVALHAMAQASCTSQAIMAVCRKMTCDFLWPVWACSFCPCVFLDWRAF